MSTVASDELSPAEVARYREDGFLPGPYYLCAPDEMAAIRERIEREVLGTDPPFADVIPEEEVRRGSTRRQWRHLLPVFNLGRHIQSKCEQQPVLRSESKQRGVAIHIP